MNLNIESLRIWFFIFVWWIRLIQKWQQSSEMEAITLSTEICYEVLRILYDHCAIFPLEQQIFNQMRKSFLYFIPTT
jgi:hypothetical protein